MKFIVKSIIPNIIVSRNGRGEAMSAKAKKNSPKISAPQIAKPI